MHKDRKTGDFDIAWGAEAIGKDINRTAEQTRYLFRIGAFGDAVKKLGHKTLVGDRRKLRQFPNITNDN